ncbi:MAG: hypothetical protein L0Y80_02155 [Ignavibacteriae bacterium]|nr:hypothetical protein [Ignavibacteriota bacterium]
MKTLCVMVFIAVVLFFQKATAQQIEVRGGNPVLSITTAVIGSEPTVVVNTTSTLRYRRQNRVTKITVQTSRPSQSFTLKALAQSVPLGTAAPEVTLTNGMPATDFVVNIPAGSNIRRTCTLRYTASATFAQGNSAEMGNDVHTVTYTLVRQ